MTTPNESNDLPGELSIAEGVKQQRWPHTMNAAVWADEWFKVIVPNPGIASDRATMIGWFANAIMAGWDTARMRHRDQPNEIPTPRSLAAWRKFTTAELGSKEEGDAIGGLYDVARQLERELAEAKAERDDLRTAMAQRQFDGSARQIAEKERDQWRECAERFYTLFCIFMNGSQPNHVDSVKALDYYYELNRKCQPSPTPSSPPDYYSSQAAILMHDHDPQKQSSPPSSPTAHASSAPASGRVILDTASRLAALERSQELLLRRTDWLWGQLSDWTHTGKLTIHTGENPTRISFKTEWPADLVPTASTSISQPTPKPSASANERSR